MSTDLPAMRRFKENFLSAESNPLAMWLSTELAPAFGRGEEWDPFVTLVRDVEDEGSALIGAKPCPGQHGAEEYGGMAEVGPCFECGARR